MRAAFAVTAIVAIVALSALMAATTDFSKAPRTVSLVQPAKAQGGCAVTRDQWEMVRLGISQSRVATILECPGDVVTEFRSGSYDTRQIRYDTASGGFVLVTFHDRRVVMKSGTAN